jgi:gluconolactonase
VRLLATGLVYTEGPAADDRGNLYFTDYKAGPGRIYKRDAAGNIELWVADSNRANGLAINKQGEVLACQMNGQVVAYQPDGQSYRVLAASYRTRRFNAPNDLTVDEHGGVYFTDPCFDAPLLLPQRRTAVYYIAPCGEVTRVIDDVCNPNGIVLSRDGQTLYVISSCRRDVLAYAVLAPGQLGPARAFARLACSGNPFFPGGDGAAIDRAGNLYVTSQRGVQVFDPAGQLLKIIAIPERPSNIEVSPDGQTLFITAGRSLYAADRPTGGE